MRVTIDLMKKSTQIIDLSNVINPRVGDDDLLLPLHVCYGDNLYDMRGKDVEFLSNDPNKNSIYIAGTCNTDTPGDNLYTGDLTFRFPTGTFKVDGTYDQDQTMFRIVDKATQKVISSVNVKITVMKNAIEFNFDSGKSSYDSRAETMLQDFHDKGQAMLDEIKDLNNQAKSNVSGDTADTANEAKQQANANAGDISDLTGEVTGARGRFSDLPGREDAQDTAINQKETIVNANANYTALQQKDAQQDTAISQKETIVNANANYAALQQKDAQQDAALNQKAEKFELEEKLSQMHVEPEGFKNLDDLKAKYPNGNSNLNVTVDNGHLLIWLNNAWNDCGQYQASGLSAEVRSQLTYLDASDEVTKSVLQAMTDQVVDLQWFVGSVDTDTGTITPKDISVNAYSAPRVLDGSRTFRVDFDSKTLSHFIIFELDSDGKVLSHNYVPAGGMYAPSAGASAVRFEIFLTTGTMGQNDLRSVIHDSGLKITDYGARSLVNDVNRLNLTNHLLPLMSTKGKTINTNVDYGAKVNKTLNNVSTYQVVDQACQPGDIFIITNLGGGVSALGWAFLDKDSQLLSKSLSNAKADLITLYAPSNANELIVNSSLSDFAVYKYTPDASHLAETNIAEGANVNYNIKLAFQPGETVSLSPENVGGYKYEVLSCKAGDEFKICGVGGNNPRLYAFLTADNHLINVAKPGLNASNGIYIKAPNQADKLVVNYVLGDNNPVELYKLPNGTINQQITQFKQLATPPVDVRMASYLNGIKLGKDLSTHLADFAKSGDKMVHVSTFYKIADTLYMSYYANTRTAAEDPTQHTARLVYAPFNNLTQQTYIDVADIGQNYNGQTIDAIYDSLLLKTSDDSYMIYAFTAKVGGKFYMLYRRFDPNTKLLSDINTMSFKAGSLSGTFDTVSVHDSLAQIGVDYDYEDRDISFIQKLSPRVEDGATYYYTGIGILHMCFIVKSSDLINWTFVSAPDFKYKPEFEPSVYVKGDCVYYLCRQRGTEGNAVLATYNIPNDQWSKPILVPDTQSRYDFFENNNQLYLVHSPLDRNHISLIQIDQNILEKSYEVATAKVQDCFYPFTQNIDGQMYMSFTQSRQHIWLNKFSPTYYSNDEVANVFSKITE